MIAIIIKRDYGESVRSYEEVANLFNDSFLNHPTIKKNQQSITQLKVSKTLAVLRIVLKLTGQNQWQLMTNRSRFCSISLTIQIFQ